MTRFTLLAASLGGALLASTAASAGGDCATCYRRAFQPAVYDRIDQRVLVRGPRTYDHVLPGRFATVTEKVVVAPERKAWRVTRDAWGNLVGCWVVEPAQVAVRHRSVMVEPPLDVPVAVPSLYGLRSRTVQVEPAHWGWEPITPY